MMRRAAGVALLIFIGATVLQSCAINTGDSGSHATSEIDATIDVTQLSDGRLVVEARLIAFYPSDPGYSGDALHLSRSDKLVASIDQALAASGSIDGDQFDAIGGLVPSHHRMVGGVENDWWHEINSEQRYETSFEGISPGQTVYVEFYRSNNADALGSYAVLPAGFEISAPSAGQPFSSSGDDITMSWGPIDATASMKISADQRCPDGSNQRWTSTQTPDTGTATITAGTFAGSADCQLIIIVDRYRNGVVDANFHQGQFLAHQKRRVLVSTNP